MATAALMITMEITLLTSSGASGDTPTAAGCGEEGETPPPTSSSGCRSSSSTTRNGATSSSSRWSARRRRATVVRAASRAPASCAGRSSVPTKMCTCTGVTRGSAARSAGGSRSCWTRPESTRPWSERSVEIWLAVVTTTGHTRHRRWRSGARRGDY